MLSHLLSFLFSYPLMTLTIATAQCSTTLIWYAFACTVVSFCKAGQPGSDMSAPQQPREEEDTFQPETKYILRSIELAWESRKKGNHPL